MLQALQAFNIPAGDIQTDHTLQLCLGKSAVSVEIGLLRHTGPQVFIGEQGLTQAQGIGFQCLRVKLEKNMEVVQGKGSLFCVLCKGEYILFSLPPWST